MSTENVKLLSIELWAAMKFFIPIKENCETNPLACDANIG